MESKDLVNEEKEELLALLLEEEGLQQFFQHQTIHDLVQQLRGSEAISPVVPRTQAFDLISPEDRTRLQWLRNRTGRTDKGGA